MRNSDDNEVNPRETLKKNNSAAVGGWGNGLGMRTAKNSVKTVFFNFREYLCFFTTLFIIQSMFWMLCFTVSTNIVHEREKIELEYNYHMIISDISANEKTAMEYKLWLKTYQNIRSFETYEFLPPDEYHDDYRLNVRLREGSSAQTFIDYYINSTVTSENVTITYTPLYSYMTDYIAENFSNGILVTVLLTLLSAVIIMALYNVRINHFKFLYGIYMTCGAGFRKLFSTAVWEMMVISLTTLFASLGVTYLAVSIMYATVGTSLKIYMWMIPAVFLLNLITVYISVYAPMKHMSRRTPLSLIISQDNSNLVSSPRRSFRIFNKTFPYHYELYSIWRFRKYFASTLITAVLFTSLFVCGVYIGHMRQTAEEVTSPEFTVTADIGAVDITGYDDSGFNINDVVDIMNDAQSDGIESIEGVNYSLWENETKASLIISHVLMSRGNLSGGAEYSVMANGRVDGYSVATNSFKYSAFDKHYIDTVSRLYEVDGDPYAVLEDDDKVIISDSIYNKKCFDFAPGNKIYLAKFMYRDKVIDQIYMNDTDFLQAQLESYVFEYTEYEVAAVIHGGEPGQYFTVGMNYDAYYSFTGSKDVSSQIRVWLDSDVTPDKVEGISDQLRIKLRDYINIYMIDTSVQSNYSTLRSALVADRCSFDTIIIISVMLLLLSPVIWFFSQILFYAKREKEIGILRMFGADEKSLRGVYSFAGLIMAALSIIMTVLLSFVSSFAVYKLFNQVLPTYGFVSSIRYEFYMSLTALLISIAVSVACGYLSSYIPYKIGRNRRECEYARQLSEQN